MDMTTFFPARRKLTAAVAVGAMALTLTGLHVPGAGAASLHPPECQLMIVADSQVTVHGSVDGEIQAVPVPADQAGTQAGSVSTQETEGHVGQTGQTGQTEQPGGTSSAASAPQTVLCVAAVGGVSDPMCAVIFSDAAGQTGVNGIFSTAAGTSPQHASSAGTAPAGGTQQTVPAQVPGSSQAQTGGAGPTGNQALYPNEPAAEIAVEQGTQGARGSTGAPGAPAGEAGTSTSGATTLLPGQPFDGTSGADVTVASAIPGGTVAMCGTSGGVGAGAHTEVIENVTTNANSTTGAVPAIEQAEQDPAGECEEMVVSETPLPSGGSVKISVTPC